MELATTDPLAFICFFMALGIVVTNLIYILSTNVWHRWIKIAYIVAGLAGMFLYWWIIFIGHAPARMNRLTNLTVYGSILMASISSLGRITTWFCRIRKAKCETVR